MSSMQSENLGRASNLLLKGCTDIMYSITPQTEFVEMRQKSWANHHSHTVQFLEADLSAIMTSGLRQ